MNETVKPPATLRLAATMLLLRDDPFEVLMVRRSERHGDQFSSALVFPGGVVDPEDRDVAWLDHVEGAEGLSDEERALRIAGCRETFEEAGILLARDAQGACPVPGAAIGGQSFHALIRALDARLVLDDFAHFAHWITPEMAPRRFDTHFFLCRAPDGAEAVCDGQETVALEWGEPAELLRRANAGETHIVFPTRVNLMRLAESRDVASALAAARARPRFTVLPQPVRHESGLTVVIPAEAGYGVTEDWLPREG
jgi:8-oxo-dGTP pyrophosphatase MutT (NUDIX family)